MLCGLGGILSCGITHTLVTPLDLVKCRIQVNPAKYKSVFNGFRVSNLFLIIFYKYEQNISTTNSISNIYIIKITKILFIRYDVCHKLWSQEN